MDTKSYCIILINLSWTFFLRFFFDKFFIHSMKIVGNKITIKVLAHTNNYTKVEPAFIIHLKTRARMIHEGESTKAVNQALASAH